MAPLRLPSGIEITIPGLFRQLATLTSEDIDYVFTSRKAKAYRQPIGELLGKAFAGLYNRRRQAITRSNVNFWKLKNGSFKKKFIQTAVNARIHNLDLDMLILRAEILSRSKRMGCYPSPHLVCGDYVFGEVLNGWTPAGDEPPAPDVIDDLGTIDQGNAEWIWQPGHKWDEKSGKFVRDDEC
jgi:hypothetical protein